MGERNDSWFLSGEPQPGLENRGTPSKTDVKQVRHDTINMSNQQ